MAPRKGYPIGEQRQRVKALADEICARYQAGASAAELERIYGIGDTSISALLKRRGIPSQAKFHMGRYRRGQRGPSSPAWKGGRVIDRAGYVHVTIERADPMFAMSQVRRDGGSQYVLEHRLVLARHLGRLLTRAETVHHINGDKQDNRIENLQLRNGRHGRGAAWQCADCGSRNIIATTLLDV